MRKIYPIVLSILVTAELHAQNITLTKNEDTTKAKQLDEVVITGQYKPQSLKNSVYQVRTISNERIQLSGATNVPQVLATQLGFRFSNDNTLGTTDVQLMGVSGRNVKILLDGVPMIDRGDTRESLGQIDIHSIERIEVVEGPMSVSYGSDALAGVINIITKKNVKPLTISAKLQEETAGKEYYPFSYKGVHTQNLAVASGKKNWNFSIGGTHNDFDGFGGDAYGRNKTWKPKEQWLGNVKLGYANQNFTVYYRLDGLQELIKSRGEINTSTWKAIDKRYTTDRWMHQVQSVLRISDKLKLNSLLAYTNYSRQTRTTRHDFEKNTDELTSGAGEQDLSKFNGLSFKSTLDYEISQKISIQPGVDINRESASGERINGKPVITDYAAFISSELKIGKNIQLRPGLRFIKNSVYDAPPVIPSLNSKFTLNSKLDLRLAYAYGFRSPALRELYFSFHDANHDIEGNPDLKAEHSNSFNGSLNWYAISQKNLRLISILTAFYNVFENQIDLAQSASNPNLYSYFNVNKAKTTGFSLDNRLKCKDADASLGFNYIGFYYSIYNDPLYTKSDNRDFLWTPEINSSFTYHLNRWKTSLSLFYIYTGKRPSFAFGTSTSGQDIIYVAKTSSYNWADFMIATHLVKWITLNTGIKNIFDVTNVNNTATASIHNGAGPAPIGYGRSYVLGLSFNWNK